MKALRRNGRTGSSRRLFSSCLSIGILLGSISICLTLFPCAHAAWSFGGFQKSDDSTTTTTTATATATATSAGPVDRICSLGDKVEMVYNSTLDEYVYRDIEEEIEEESSSEQSYRRCSCHDDVLNYLGDEWDKLCPLEAQTCAIVYLDNEKDEILCYTMNPRVGVIRYTWLVLWLWMCLVTVTLVMSEAGNQAIHYGIIRTCGAFCCCCCTDDDSVGRNNPFVTNFGEAYNSFFIERTLQREARRRGIRISRWEIMRERMTIERGDFATEEQDAATRPRASMAGQSQRQSQRRNSQGRTNQQWLGEWRGVSAAIVSSQRRIDEWLRQLSDTQGSMSGADTDTDVSRTRRSGIQKLALRTKIYGKADYICKSCGSPSREDDPEQPAITITKSDNDDDASAGGNTDTNSSCNHQDEEEDEVVCIICFGLIENGDKVGDLPHCNHLFHTSCLKTWIARKNACPMCMKPIAKPTTSSCRLSRATRREHSIRQSMIPDSRSSMQ